MVMENPQSWAALIAAFSALILAILDRRRDAARAVMEEQRRTGDRDHSEILTVMAARDENLRLLYEERAKVARLEAELAFRKALDEKKEKR